MIAGLLSPFIPGVSFGGGRMRHLERDQQREIEFQRVLEENYNLKLQMEEMRRNQMEDSWDGRVGVLPLVHELPAEPPPPPMPPRAPVAPKSSR